jgi:uridylate kinase
MHIVLSLGGSLISTQNGTDEKFLSEIKKIIEKSGYNFGIVTGGGYQARVYANEVRGKGGNEFEADEAAIKATKENAKALIKALGKLAHKKVCADFVEAREAAKKSKVVVMGGTIPGITTDADSALLAECIGAKRLLNVSAVDAIYDSDPRKNPNAKKYSQLGYGDLIRLACGSDTRKAGENFVFDILACKLIARSKIETSFVSGKNLDDVKAALEGKAHSGTVIR